MAHHKSAKKRARQTIRKTARNKSQRSAARSAIKAIRNAIGDNKKDEAAKLLPKAQSLLDRLSKMGVITPNSAARYTGRLARQVAAL